MQGTLSCAQSLLVLGAPAVAFGHLSRAIAHLSDG